MTRSTGTSGLIFSASPPSACIALRIAARSTTAGTPVKSCISTRAVRNASSCSNLRVFCHFATAMGSAFLTVGASSRPGGLSSRPSIEWGRWGGKMRLSGRQIGCVRGGREVFSGLDFEAASGQALAVVGPNGSGKTSLLRLIAGLLVPSGGSVALDGGAAELTLPEQAHYL